MVLDPFAGVGTTLLQAIQRGHDAVGFEINPYPSLASSVKLRAWEISLSDLDDAIGAMRRTARCWREASPPNHIAAPELRTRIPFLSPRVERQVLHALAFINSIEDTSVRDLFRTAFGAVIVGVSNYSYEPSLGTRPSAGKPLVEDTDVGAILLDKLQHMRADIAWLREESPSRREIGHGKVITGNFLTDNVILEPRSVDLMVTSPPYMNNYHYIRNTRPQLYWLSLISSPQEQRNLETGNFGKYWQTVRSGEHLHLEFENRDLSDIVSALRETRKSAGSYGGAGWANYVVSYFNDCDRFLAALKRVMKRGGAGVIVIGNSIIQGLEIKVEQILGQMAAQHGFKLEGIPCIRSKRVGASITRSSVRRGLRNSATLYESAVIIKRL
jgi:hypothetical protein